MRLEPPLIGSFFAIHGEDRLIVTPAETPPLLTDALKVVEDRNFDTHAGFDLKGIARAAWADLRAGDLAQGGSTLTQQLVKSYFLDNRRTLLRKLKELAMAVILDARYTKDDLLNAYINEIYLGQDGERAIHGFGLGSQFYFNKPLSELDPAEIALLIAVIRGPSYYNPFTHPERAHARRDLVLGLMFEFGLISEQAHKAAIHQPLALTRSARQGGGYYPAFLDLVREQLGHDYDATELASRGYRVFTTLSPRRSGCRRARGCRYARSNRSGPQTETRRTRSRVARRRLPDRRNRRSRRRSQSRLPGFQSRVERAPTGRFAAQAGRLPDGAREWRVQPRIDRRRRAAAAIGDGEDRLDAATTSTTRSTVRYRWCARSAIR